MGVTTGDGDGAGGVGETLGSGGGVSSGGGSTIITSIALSASAGCLSQSIAPKNSTRAWKATDPNRLYVRKDLNSSSSFSLWLTAIRERLILQYFCI